MKRTLNKRFIKGFTLVELIIVITILAILATIAFISFQGYSKNSRDGNRLTTMKNIESGLGIYYTQIGNYPDTESGTLIQSSGGLITIGTQGYFGDINSRLLKFSKTPTDPFDGDKYIYSVNERKNKYQIMGFLETSDYLSLVNNAYANDYLSRYPKTLGDNLGILLDTNNNPISGAGIDIENYTGSLKAIFSNTYSITGTGISIKVLKSTFKDGKMWKNTDNNCDLPDVVIGDQVWAGCNSTIGDGIEFSGNNVSSCYSYSASTTTTECSDVNYMASNKKEKAWSVASGNAKTVNNIWGKLYIHSNTTTACPTGRRVPSDQDFKDLEQVLGCSVLDLNRVGAYGCTGLGWDADRISNNIVEKLQLPLSGRRSTDGSNFLTRGYYTNLWSSTIGGNGAYGRNLSQGNAGVYRNSRDTNYSFSIRCIKN